MTLEALENAQKELKRADHLIFVSLKYTRTVDVIKNIVTRLLSVIDLGYEVLLKKGVDDKKLAEVPKLPRIRVDEVKRIYGSDPKIMQFIDFYQLLRKIDKAHFDRKMEYRRHVTMTADMNGEKVEVTIDIISDYFQRTKEFISHVQEIVIGKPEEGEQ